MAASDCVPCGSGFPVEYLELLNCKNQSNTRQAGIQQLAFIKCDEVLSAITNSTEWDTLKTTPGAVIRTPSGLGSWGKPNTSQVKIGCKEEVVTEKTLVITFKTFKYDNDTFADADFMCKLNDGFSGYKIIWLGCDGHLYYSNAWTTGDNPGLTISLLNSWDDNPENGLMSKNFEITLNMIDVCYTLIAPSAALVTAIFAGTSNTSGGGGI